MPKKFNIMGSCNPDEHYMVNIQSRLVQIKQLVDNGQYFTINRGRQYGKTTTLFALEEYLSVDYVVISLDFQLLDTSDFRDSSSFVSAFSREILDLSHDIGESISQQLKNMKEKRKSDYSLSDLFAVLREWCRESEKPVVLMIDEVDSASNNQVFLDFLAQLRYYYLNRRKRPTFQSVILAGVHDIRNLKQKIKYDAEHKHNSPWNIAIPFDIDMNFSPEGIAGMLTEYESDYHTGMNIPEISQLIYDYTSGYPVLVSSFCKLIEEKVTGTEQFPTRAEAWTKAGFLKAEKMIYDTNASLFGSLFNKLEDSEQLRILLHKILFTGIKAPYNQYDAVIGTAVMYGFLKKEVTENSENAVISNRIFETALYNWFISIEITTSNNEMFKAGLAEKSLFVQNHSLNVELILEKFVQYFDDIYENKLPEFVEEVGRRYFLLFLKPIINGTGNYYIEAQTRNQRRTDIIVDYLGEQHIIELKIWHGEKYNADGEQQLSDYLDYYHLKKGYMLTFNFNKNKEIGVKRVQFKDKELIEATV